MSHLFLKCILALIAQEAFVASAAGVQCPLPDDDLSLLQKTLKMKRRVNEKGTRYCCCTKANTLTQEDCIAEGRKEHERLLKPEAETPDYAAGKYSRYTGFYGPDGPKSQLPEEWAGLAWAAWNAGSNQCCKYKNEDIHKCGVFARRFNVAVEKAEEGNGEAKTSPICRKMFHAGLAEKVNERNEQMKLEDEQRLLKLKEEADRVAKEAADAKAAKEKARRDRRPFSRAKYQTQTDINICSIAAKEGNCHTVVRAESKPCNHYWYTNKWGNNKMCDERSGLTCGHSKNPFRSSADCPPGTR